MNKLTDTRRAAVIGALCEGLSVRATCRLTGTAKGTVLKLLAEVGQAAEDYQNVALVNLPTKRVECDEIWSFVGAKEKNTQPELRGTAERGDAWVWTAIDADNKLAVAWQVGPRDADSAKALMEGVAARVAGRRFTRLTNAFSKKLENHAHAVSLFFLHYNFCRAHQTLTMDKKGVKCTPAMAAGIADHVWKIEEIVALLSN